MLTAPGIVIVLATLGLLLQKRWRYLGTTLLWISVIALVVFSLPITGRALLESLEESAVPLASVEDAVAAHAGAIVVLGGGRAADQPQYAGDTVSSSTLERLRYAARLQRATGLPLLVTGGSVFGERTSEAELMQQTLTRDFNVPVTWVESRSHNTFENAIFTRAILEAAGKKKILLVTDASHMPRALWVFRHAGMDPIMAPTNFTGGGKRTLLDFLPSSQGLNLSDRALHERLGLMWYRLRYGTRFTTAAGGAPNPNN